VSWYKYVNRKYMIGVNIRVMVQIREQKVHDWSQYTLGWSEKKYF
jgi:hypothetical protein